MSYRVARFSIRIISARFLSQTFVHVRVPLALSIQIRLARAVVLRMVEARTFLTRHHRTLVLASTIRLPLARALVVKLIGTCERREREVTERQKHEREEKRERRGREKKVSLERGDEIAVAKRIGGRG